MNSKLDILIEKYLDGKLSKKEQSDLDIFLKENENLVSFRVADKIQKTILNEANEIEYPNEFISDVQDMILMKYLQEISEDTKLILPIEKIGFNVYPYLKYAAVILIFFIASIISIKEFSPTSRFRSIVNKSAYVENKKNEPTQNTIISKNTFKTINKVSNNLTQLNDINEALFDFENAVTFEYIETPNLDLALFDYTLNNNKDVIFEEKNNEKTEQSIIDLNGVLANRQMNIPNNLQNLNNINQVNFVPAYKLDAEQIGKNRLQLNSTVSNGFATLGLQLSDNSVNSFSQSISYKFDSKTAIGVELGLTQFTAKVLREVLLVTQTGESNYEDNPFNNNGDIIKIKIPLKEQQSLVWTTIYYERLFLNTKNTKLTGRLGVGITDSDPVIISNIVGKQRIYNNLFLTLGVDSKIFKTTINGAINSDYLSTFNVIYGLQFDL